MAEQSALDLAMSLRDLAHAQLEAARAGEWEQVGEHLQQRGECLQRLQAIDPGCLSPEEREAIAAVLEEVRAADRELSALVEAALEEVRAEQRALERNDAAVRGYRRALGAAEDHEIVDREA